ncbi:MAG: HhoA/HhoB/HtrA family serine endopeptidase [Leptolyngbya sp.]|nr:HhoA/HhoB/HtrA family serine endopeptidase [Leptolyngbya sp.]
MFKLISGGWPWHLALRQVLAITLMALVVFTSHLPPALAQETAPAVPLPSAPTATVPRSFVAVAVEQVGPAVVRIDTEKTIVRDANPLFEDPFFRDFFGGPGGFPNSPREELLRGQGSGFIITPEGDILTNAHVVNGADRVTVTLKDGRRFEGTVEGADEVTDLAVVKIDDGDDSLPVAALGDSDQVQVGDWAIAVGNPLGLDNTVTLGIVSTLKRSSADVGIPNKRLEFIQTDAAINPGNSGGPLLNQNGEVIGINTAIRADAMGIGFAIPINKAKEIKDQLARGEAIAHPYLGVQIATLTPDMAQQNNEDPNAGMMLPEVTGALVVRVVPDTPAAEAGLRRGDVIVQVDDAPVTSADELQTLVENSRVGQTLRLTVKRGRQTQQIRVNTAALDSDR